MRTMATIETHSDGKAILSVFTNDGWITHEFCNIDTLKKYYLKAVGAEDA